MEDKLTLDKLTLDTSTSSEDEAMEEKAKSEAENKGLHHCSAQCWPAVPPQVTHDSAPEATVLPASNASLIGKPSIATPASNMGDVDKYVYTIFCASLKPPDVAINFCGF